jgi:hypothetical protein
MEQFRVKEMDIASVALVFPYSFSLSKHREMSSQGIVVLNTTPEGIPDTQLANLITEDTRVFLNTLELK